jgi:hypothetical protein
MPAISPNSCPSPSRSHIPRLQGAFWYAVDPPLCSWDMHEDKGLRISLEKDSSRLGSWPHIFRSLEATPRAGTGACQRVPTPDRDAFEAEALERLRGFLEDSSRMREDFIRGAKIQMGEHPPAPALLLPWEPVRCRVLLERLSQEAPAVTHLVRRTEKVKITTKKEGLPPMA